MGIFGIIVIIQLVQLTTVGLISRQNENYVEGLGDDNIVGPFNVAPAFDYYWYSVDKIWIGSNGYVGFKPVQISSAISYQCLQTLTQKIILLQVLCVI